MIDWKKCGLVDGSKNENNLIIVYDFIYYEINGNCNYYNFRNFCDLIYPIAHNIFCNMSVDIDETYLISKTKFLMKNLMIELNDIKLPPLDINANTPLFWDAEFIFKFTRKYGFNIRL